MSGTKESRTPTTEEQWAQFLSSLSVCGNITQACKTANICRMTAYNRKNDDEEFEKAWKSAAILGGQGLEDEARRRAFDGWTEPKYYQDTLLEHIQKYSDTLLIFLLKGLFPDKYRDRVSTDHSGKVEIDHGLDLTKLTTEELEVIRKLVEKARSEV